MTSNYPDDTTPEVHLHFINNSCIKASFWEKVSECILSCSSHCVARGHSQPLPTDVCLNIFLTHLDMSGAVGATRKATVESVFRGGICDHLLTYSHESGALT